MLVCHSENVLLGHKGWSDASRIERIEAEARDVEKEVKAYLAKWMLGNEVRMIIEDGKAGMRTPIHSVQSENGDAAGFPISDNDFREDRKTVKA